jgi:hypothetical protein
MRWPWSKRHIPPAIPPSPYRPIEPKTVEQPEPGIVVEEHDSADVDIAELQSRTGMQRVFDRLTGKFKD